MLTREKVIESIDGLPPVFTIDDLVDRLIFVQKVERGLHHADTGQVFSTIQAKEMLSKWKPK